MPKFWYFPGFQQQCSLARLPLLNLIHYKDFPTFLLCFWDSVSPRENYLHVYDDLEETRTWPPSCANLSPQQLCLGLEHQGPIPKFCWIAAAGIAKGSAQPSPLDINFCSWQWPVSRLGHGIDKTPKFNCDICHPSLGALLAFRGMICCYPNSWEIIA